MPKEVLGIIDKITQEDKTDKSEEVTDQKDLSASDKAVRKKHPISAMRYYRKQESKEMAEYFSPGVYVEEYDDSPRGMEVLVPQGL